MKVINDRYRIIESVYHNKLESCYKVVDVLSNDELLELHAIHDVQYSEILYSHFMQHFIKYASLEHPNITAARRFNIIKHQQQVIKASNYFYVVDNINQLLIDYDSLIFEDKLSVLQQIIQAMRYCHFRGVGCGHLSRDDIVVYRDIHAVLRAKISAIPTIIANNFISENISLVDDESLLSGDVKSLIHLILELLNAVPVAKLNQYDALKKKLSTSLEVIDTELISIEGLIEILQNETFMQFPFNDKAYYEKIDFNIAIISRKNELCQIAEEINKRFDGNSTQVGAFVIGRSGIGKTRFLREVEFRLNTKGRFVYAVDLLEVSNNPYRCLLVLLKQFIDSGRISKTLIAQYGNQIVKILPEYSNVWGIMATETAAPASWGERLKLNTSIIQFIVEASRLISPIIIIDNIQFLNENELTLLQMLFEAIADAPIYIICSATYDVFAKDSYNLYRPVKEMLKINLDELNQVDIDQLLHNIFYDTEDFDYINDSVKALTSGSPRSIEILLKSFIDNGIIWVNQERKWQCRQFDYQTLDYKQKIADAYKTILNSLDEASTLVLKYISLFKEAVDIKILKQLLDIYDIDVSDAVDRLIADNYLSLEYQLSSEFVNFIDAELKQIIYDQIPNNKKIKCHQKAAEIYRTANNKWQRTNYLYHLLRSNQYQLALEVALTLAQEIEKMQFVEKAISLREIARDIALKLNNIEVAIGIIKRIADTYYYKGDVEIAYLQYKELAAIARQHHFNEAYLDAEIKRVEIDLRCGRLNSFDHEIELLVKNAKAINFHKGHFDICYIKFMRCLNTEDIGCARHLLATFEEISARDNSEYLAAKMQIVKGLIYDFDGDYDLAFRCMQEAKRLLSVTDYSYEMAIVENNLGVLTVEILGDLKRAKAHFRSALNLLKKATIIIESNKLLNNLGEIQRYEGNLIDSLNSHHEALRISYQVQDIEEVMLTYAHLIETYSKLSKYELAYQNINNLTELLEEYSDIILIGLYERIYYAISLFYLMVFKKTVAQKYFAKFMQSKTDYLDHLSSFRMHVHQFTCQYYLVDNRLEYSFDYNDIRRMISLATRDIEKALLKETLLDIIIDIICFDGRDALNELLKCYRQIESVDYSRILSYKQSIVAHYIDRSEALSEIDSCDVFYHLADEEKLKVYIIMGNYFALKGDYYYALRQYLEAVDNIRSVYLTLDGNLREDYVLKDELKRNLFDCINILMNKIDKSFEIPNDMNVTSLLNLEPYHNLYHSEAFKHSIFRRYRQKHSVIFEKLADMLDRLDSDNENNITIALKYLTQLVFADFASLIMISADQTISKVFEIEDNTQKNSYSVLISNYVSVNKPIILDESTLCQMGIYDLKKAMLIPVYAKYSQPENQNKINRRRKQIRDYEHPQAIIIIASYSRLNFFSDNMIKYVEQTLPILYLIIDNYNLYRSSTIDKLTGVYLRKPLEKIFQQQIEECKRMNESLSVVMLDIDHFKVINDEYGHRKGDQVLTQIADIIVKSVRLDDAVGRYGGEEFVVLLPTASAKLAFQIAERIRQNVYNAELLDDNKRVTISAGISVYPQMGSRQNELIEKADKALYVSKHKGRNLSTVYAIEKMTEEKRFDPLAGILTGTTSRDARVMKVIVDIIALTALSKPLNQKIQIILETLIDLLEASDATIVDLAHGVKYLHYVKSREKKKILHTQLTTKNDYVNDEYEREGYFIKWDHTEEFDGSDKRPRWYSHIQCPIVENGIKKGLIIIRVPIANKKYEFSDYNIVLHIGRIIGSLF